MCIAVYQSAMILNINTAETTKKMITQIKAERLNKGNMKHNAIYYYCELYVG